MAELIKEPKLCSVEWQDAHSGSGWYTDTEAEKFINKERCICHNVGWIISETQNEIVLACRRVKWAEDSQSLEADPKWGLLQKIPKAWVRKVEVLVPDLISRVEAISA